MQKKNKGGYSNSIEHLLDECKRMGLLLQIAARNIQESSPPRNGDIHNLFISNDEANGLLNESLETETEKDEKKFLLEIEGLRRRFFKLSEGITKRKNLSLKKNTFLSLTTLQHIFHLSPFETDVLILTLLPEIHIKYERIYGYLQDDITQKRPAIRLIAEILSTTEEEKAEIFRYFLHNNNLFSHEILKPVDNNDHPHTAFPSKTLIIDQRILNYIFEVNDPDPLISAFSTLKAPEAENGNGPSSPAGVEEKHIKMMRQHLSMNPGGKKLFINLSGPGRSGRKSAAEALCREADVLLLIVDMAEIIKTDTPLEALIKSIFREAALQPAAVYFQNIESLFLLIQSISIYDFNLALD